jgi:glycerol-3-phosphate dehydrogenase
MRRDISGLAGKRYDLIIVGGGVYGVCAAWEAALRGLSVALVERADFGEATTANSLHTIHGGLRYLQHLDLHRMRESIRERREWMRLAPALIKPMPFLLPTSGHGLKGPEVLAVALILNDLIAMDRNRGLAAGAGLPRGRMLTRAGAAESLKALRIASFNGAAIWYDGFNHSPERLLVALLRAAHEAGAVLANYVEATDLLEQRAGVRGIVARDALTGREFELQARCILNTAGPWVDSIRARLKQPRLDPADRLFHPSKGLNLVVRRLPFEFAVGIPVARKGSDTDALLDKGSVTYFIIPWGKYSLIGTKHLHFDGDPDALQPTRADISGLLEEINPVLGELRLQEKDVAAVKCGLLPEQAHSDANADVVLQKHASIVDHEQRDGVQGLVSVIGVKWTTARAVAEQAVNLACRKLRHQGKARRVELRPALAASSVDETRVTAEQISYAAREEMAVNLTDVIFRRTPLGFSDQLDSATIDQCADLMVLEFGWSPAERSRQIGLVRARLARMNEWRT